jgi:hypothetical protein
MEKSSGSTKFRRISAAALLLFILLFLGRPGSAQAKDTIVFIHGFLGWGRTEMFVGVKYWGGAGEDYEALLNAAGFPTVSVAVGPVSSNWDRAVEAYYQLKGGCVDYGPRTRKNTATSASAAAMKNRFCPAGTTGTRFPSSPTARAADGQGSHPSARMRQ